VTVALAKRATTTRAARAVSARARGAVGFVMALPPIIFISVFVGFPILLAFGFSIGLVGGLNSTAALIGQGVHRATSWWGTPAAYQEMFTSPRFLLDLLVTVVVTIVSTVVVIFLALGIGLYLRLKGGRIAKLLSGLAIVPLFIPVVIASWSILTFYSATGFLQSVFAQIGVSFPVWSYTIVAIIIGSVWTSLPFAVLMVSSGLQAVPDALSEAARDAGAGFVRIVLSVLIPLASVPIIIATTFTAIGVIGSFTVPYFTGPTSPTMLGVAMSNYFTAFNQPQQAVVMAFVVFLIASGIAALYVWANFRSAKEPGRS
jgi:ABC-type sugar transport system permease subunit